MFHRRFALALLAACVGFGAAAQDIPFEKVVAQLASSDAGERLSAVKLLRESGYQEAMAPVAALLADPDEGVRREAVYAELGLAMGNDAARKRMGLAAGRDAWALESAFESNWGAMPAWPVPIQVVTGLLPSLKDRSAKMRIEAAHALGILGQVDGRPPVPAYKEVVEAMADRLGDADRGVRIAVARAAGRVFRRCPSGCAPVAVDRVGDALIRLLNDSDPGVQGAAMEALGEIRYERSVKGLTELFQYYKSGAMAYGALDTLARIGHATAVPLFKAAITSKDPNFRRAAVEGLARVGEKDAVPAAMAAGERDKSVSLALAFAGARAGAAGQAARLVQALEDRDLALQAQDYLVELGPAAAKDLASLLGSAPSKARVLLLDALGVVGGTGEAAAIEPLQNDKDAGVAAAASRALLRIRR